MNGNSHPWSSDPATQGAIRAAEPERGPTLAHHEVPAMVEKLGAALVATHTSLSKVDRAIALALEGVANRVARLEGWIDNRRAENGGIPPSATSVAEAYAFAARQAEAAARDHTSTFVMPDPMRSAPEGPVEWRILKAEETILEGDQYQGQGQWFETNAAGTRLPVGHPVAYRRRVKSTAAPAANAGGEANCPAAPDSSQEPVAWGVLVGGKIDRHAGSDALFIAKDDADDWCGAASLRGRGTVVPLCAAPVAESATTPQPPRGWLTEEERKCLTFLLDSVCVSRETDECIKALLARSTPPRVKLPPEIAGMLYDAVSVRNAIRAAGVEVTS